MNGRAYDYNLGRFLSVDPFIQAPGNSQSMNPYSYIMNNPLAGTDPTGYTAQCTSNGEVCDVGDISTDDIESVQITENGNAIVNTTDGNSYQIETVNGKDVQGNLKTAHDELSKGIEQIGNVVRNMPAADGNFVPSGSEFREDLDDPRNQYKSDEYLESGSVDANGNYERRSYGGTYSWQAVPKDSEGNSYTRHKATKWGLIRAPSEGENHSSEGDNFILSALSEMIPAKRVKKLADLAVGIHDLLKDEYVWYREHRQEELMAEYRNDAIKYDSGNVYQSGITTKVSNFHNLKATGRIRWSVIPGTQKDEIKTYPKNLNPNALEELK